MNQAHEALWDQMMAVADGMSPAIAAAFLETVARLTALYSEAELAQALNTGQLDLFIDEAAANVFAMAPLREAIHTAVTTAGKAAAEAAPNRITVVFDGYSPSAVKVVQNQGARLVQQVSDDIRATIRKVVTDGIKSRQGVGPMARDIRDFIGLTTKQQQAVSNFRQMLESGDDTAIRTALTRELRDKRYDKVLERLSHPGAPPLAPEKIDQMVEGYRQKYLTFRSETIARTESITALNAGQTAAWTQAVEQEQLPASDILRFWHTARDERTCPTCLPIPRMNPEGVALDGLFQTPEGPVDGPTMHPRCRCTVFVKPFFR